jgi:hypothetical protein
MARNRVIYQSEGLYVSTDASVTAVGSHKQLDRIQSANYNFSIARQDINQFGQLSRIDTLVLEAPTVNLDLSYYLTDGVNERALGFLTNNAGSFLSGHMTSTSGKNLFIISTKEGVDATTLVNGDTVSAIAIGNAYLSNYSAELSVGSIPTVSASFEGANICSKDSCAFNGTNITTVTHPAIKQEDGSIYTATTVTLPKLTTGNSSITALRPGDITLSFGGFESGSSSTSAPFSAMGGNSGIHIQSASIAIPLSRTPLQRLGSKFPFARTVNFPVKSTVSVKAILNEIQSRNLADMLNDSTEKDIIITLFQEGSTTAKVQYIFKSCTLDSESFSSSIGSNKTVDLTFSTQVGSIDDTTKGIFVNCNNTQ